MADPCPEAESHTLFAKRQLSQGSHGGRKGSRTWTQTIVAAKARRTVAFAVKLIAAGILGAVVGWEKTVEAVKRGQSISMSKTQGMKGR